MVDNTPEGYQNQVNTEVLTPNVRFSHQSSVCLHGFFGRMWTHLYCAHYEHFILQHPSSVRFFWVCRSVHHSVDLPGEQRTHHVNIHWKQHICVKKNKVIWWHKVMTHQDRESPRATRCAPLGWVNLHLSPCSNHLEEKSHTGKCCS